MAELVVYVPIHPMNAIKYGQYLVVNGFIAQHWWIDRNLTVRSLGMKHYHAWRPFW